MSFKKFFFTTRQRPKIASFYNSKNPFCCQDFGCGVGMFFYLKQSSFCFYVLCCWSVCVCTSKAGLFLYPSYGTCSLGKKFEIFFENFSLSLLSKPPPPSLNSSLPIVKLIVSSHLNFWPDVFLSSFHHEKFKKLALLKLA